MNQMPSSLRLGIQFQYSLVETNTPTWFVIFFSHPLFSSSNFIYWNLWQDLLNNQDDFKNVRTVKNKLGVILHTNIHKHKSSHNIWPSQMRAFI